MHLCVEDTLTHCPQDLLVSYNLKAYGMMIPGLYQEFNAVYTSAWCIHSVLLKQVTDASTSKYLNRERLEATGSSRMGCSGGWRGSCWLG